jgi:hypothetical protein
MTLICGYVIQAMPDRAQPTAAAAGPSPRASSSCAVASQQRTRRSGGAGHGLSQRQLCVTGSDSSLPLAVRRSPQELQVEISVARDVPSHGQPDCSKPATE